MNNIVILLVLYLLFHISALWLAFHVFLWNIFGFLTHFETLSSTFCSAKSMCIIMHVRWQNYAAGEGERQRAKFMANATQQP